MREKYYITIILLVFSITTFGQKWKLMRYELIGGIVETNYFGDIGHASSKSNLMGLKDFDPTMARPGFYIGARYKIQDNLSARVNFSFAYLSGTDKGSINDSRGYSFNTFLFEPSVQAEYYFIHDERKFSSSAMFNRKGMINNFSKLSGYVFVGVGGAFFNPKLNASTLNTATYSSSDYIGYSKFSAVIPVGIGFKFAVDTKSSIGIEVGGRYTFTDYLDGFTTRWSKANDFYYLGMLQYVYKIRTSRKGFPDFRKSF
jgi:hypothetical protein